MLIPDEKFAADILDALDDRCSREVSTRIYGHQTKRERCWAEQQYQMVDALLGWLGRKMRPSRQDAQLQQAADVLRIHLESALRDLDDAIKEIDEMADRQWRSQWEGGRARREGGG